MAKLTNNTKHKFDKLLKIIREDYKTKLLYYKAKSYNRYVKYQE